MQGNCCRDLHVVLGGRVAAKDGPRYLLEYAGRYYPQPGETTAKGKSSIPARGWKQNNLFCCILLGMFPVFRKEKQPWIKLERNKSEDFL